MEVIIVNEHHDVVPWVHLALRRRLLPSQFKMIHFDAHPDLGALKDAEVCWRPRLLTEYLDDSEFGISEWILPLVYCGHVTSMDWVRPSFSKQIKDGEYRIGVGQLKGLKVDCEEAYFAEDYAPRAAMTNIKDFTLRVGPEASEGEYLDVCLDYFGCGDPLGGVQHLEDLNDIHFDINFTPKLVTIARSDDYTPRAVVDALQQHVLDVVMKKFRNVRVHYDLDGLGPGDILDFGRRKITTRSSP